MLGRCTIPQSVWVICLFAKLGYSQVLRPQRSQPSTGHRGSRVPSNPDEVQDDRIRQEYPIKTRRGVVLLFCERADVVADRLEALVQDRRFRKRLPSSHAVEQLNGLSASGNSGTTRVLPCSTDFSPPSHSEVMSRSRRQSLISGHRTHQELSCPVPLQPLASRKKNVTS